MKKLSQDECVQIGRIIKPELSWDWNDHFDNEDPPFYAVNGIANSNEIFMVKIYYDIDVIAILDAQTFVETTIDYTSINDILRIVNNEELNRKQTQLILNQNHALYELDIDGDGVVDLIQNDFNKLLSKHQKNIIDIDKNYIHQFVKISNFIKTKNNNLQTIFESIRDTSSLEELTERVSLLKNQIHSYEILVFHSINMIGALLSADLISFYEIYESFDKLRIFNSNWENEVSEKLKNIGGKLDDLMYSIYDMEQNIVNELGNLSYITQESFENLNEAVTRQLREIESSINTNTLLTGIQSYQLYKIVNNTKR